MSLICLSIRELVDRLSSRNITLCFRSQPTTLEDWAKLLEQQQYLHDIEIDRWKDVLGAAVTVMDQVHVVGVGQHRGAGAK